MKLQESRIRAVFSTHAEALKSDDPKKADLTDTGTKQAKSLFSNNVLNGNPVYCFYPDDDFVHVEQTVATGLQEVKPEFRENIFAKTELGLANEQGLLLISKEFLWELAQRSKKDFKRTVEWWLSFPKNVRPDENSLSPAEFSSRIVSVLNPYLFHGRLMRKSPVINLFFISYNLLLCRLVFDLLEKEILQDPINPAGKNFLEKMGGVLKLCEPVIFDITRQFALGKIEIEVIFRTKVYILKNEKLAEIYDLDKQMEKQYGNILGSEV